MIPNGGPAEAVPAELRERRQWVGWRREVRDGKPTKVPVNPHTGGRADTTAPATWGDFGAALAGAAAGRWDGVGYVFDADDPYVGIDWDNVIDPETGEWDADAAREVRAFASYAERSQSGKGVHVIVRGRLASGTRRKKGARECYDRSRFFVVTGLRESSHGVEDRQDELDRWHAATFPAEPTRPATIPIPPAPLSLTDAELLDRVRASEQGPKFARLWAGDTTGHGGDDSAADLALCSVLAYWLGTPEAVDRVFRQSGLMRPKWDREDYRRRTLDKAFAGRTEYYEPRVRATIAGGWESAAATRGPEGAADAARRGWEVVRDHYRGRYRAAFRVGDAVYSRADRREVSRAEATAALPPALIDPLTLATDAPRFPNGAVKDDSLPAFFRRWAGTAWTALLDELPDEDEADLDAVEDARELFRRLVRGVLLTQVQLGGTIGREDQARIERRSLIDWCERFAKPGDWGRIRSYECWCKCVVRPSGEVVLKVAISHGLFTQVNADRRLTAMPPKTFGKRARRYGVGATDRDDRPHGKRAVILDTEFVGEMTEGVHDEMDPAAAAV